MIDGFYAGFMSAREYGLVILVFNKGIITGVDVGGVKFDGSYQYMPEKESYIGEIYIAAPPNIQLVQGVDTGKDGLTYKVDFSVPENFYDHPYLPINTPFGPVNVRLEKLRDIPEA